MPIVRTPSRKLFLKARALAGRPALPEEKLGLMGSDPVDTRDRMRDPAGDRLQPINLLEDYPVPVLDQGRTNRCGPHTGVSGLAILHQKTTGIKVNFSVNDLYRFCRKDTSVDEGVYMRDLMQGLSSGGALTEYRWPNHTKFNAIPRDLVDPNIHHDMRYRIPGGYWRVRSAKDAAFILSTERLPIWIGCTLYEKVVNNAMHGGVFRMPNRRDRIIGGHAMLVVGWVYMDKRRHFIILNSWGSSVGRRGLFFMPEDYIHENICSDMWTVDKDIF